MVWCYRSSAVYPTAPLARRRRKSSRGHAVKLSSNKQIDRFATLKVDRVLDHTQASSINVRDPIYYGMSMSTHAAVETGPWRLGERVTSSQNKKDTQWSRGSGDSSLLFLVGGACQHHSAHSNNSTDNTSVVCVAGAVVSGVSVAAVAEPGCVSSSVAGSTLLSFGTPGRPT